MIGTESNDWPYGDLPGQLDLTAHAYNFARMQAVVRSSPADFWVEEVLGFDPDPGEAHLWLKIRKTALNTVDIVRLLSEQSGAKRRDIGYSGLKDRLAVTTQWFSLPMPRLQSRPENLPLFQNPDIELLTSAEARQKLKRGVHRANRFAITVRDIRNPQKTIDDLLVQIRHSGVPNYFGIQRFGRNGSNLTRSIQLARGIWKPGKRDRHLRSLAISSARSWLFNSVLSERVHNLCWDRAIDGDILQFDGSGSVFANDVDDTSITSRLHSGKIHPTGPMWGSGERQSTGQAAALEHKVALEFSEVSNALAGWEVKQQRRSLRLMVHNLEWEWRSREAMRLKFELTRGAFATSVLREIFS
ncbi:MAG: tRNA pseudouridine(13) synthase TruD [Pseudomonadota bacterium]